MGRISVKDNKNLFQQTREELGYSREKASEILEWIPKERIEKIESEKVKAHPEEVVAMAEAYKKPRLCNYYCSNCCPIGQKYVPEIKVKELSQIILEMLSSINGMHKKQERLIDISVDGKISNDELEDFIKIQKELEQISISVETLQLWAEQKIANGLIDLDAYYEIKKKMNN